MGTVNYSYLTCIKFYIIQLLSPYSLNTDDNMIIFISRQYTDELLLHICLFYF